MIGQVARVGQPAPGPVCRKAWPTRRHACGNRFGYRMHPRPAGQSRPLRLVIERLLLPPQTRSRARSPCPKWSLHEVQRLESRTLPSRCAASIRPASAGGRCRRARTAACRRPPRGRADLRPAMGRAGQRPVARNGRTRARTSAWTSARGHWPALSQMFSSPDRPMTIRPSGAHSAVNAPRRSRRRSPQRRRPPAGPQVASRVGPGPGSGRAARWRRDWPGPSRDRLPDRRRPSR